MILELAKKFGLEEIPDRMIELEKEISFHKEKLCSLTLIEELEEKYDFFGNYLETVKNAWQELEADEEKKLWVDVASLYYPECTLKEAEALPLPPTDETPSGDFLALFVMLPSVDLAYNEYLRRGFSAEEAKNNLSNFKRNIWVMDEFVLGRPAIVAGYYKWLCNYAKNIIFDHGCLNFEFRKHTKTSLVLRNKKSSEHRILMIDRTCHKSGHILGTAGFEDEAGSFITPLVETESEWRGHTIENHLIREQADVFPKSEWEIAIKPGDDVIGLHIPRGVNFTPEAIDQSLAEGLGIAKERYPEWKPVAFECTSWMMSPTLNEVLGDKAKISRFSARFLRFPIKNMGMDIFGYVFPKDCTDFEKFPETTSLQRALKAKYLKGERAFAYTGIIPFEK